MARWTRTFWKFGRVVGKCTALRALTLHAAPALNSMSMSSDNVSRPRLRRGIIRYRWLKTTLRSRGGGGWPVDKWTALRTCPLIHRLIVRAPLDLITTRTLGPLAPIVGLLATTYLRTVFREMPISLAMARSERPRRWAFCTASHRAFWRGVGCLGGAAGGLRTPVLRFLGRLSTTTSSPPWLATPRAPSLSR